MMLEQYEDVLEMEQVCDILKLSRNSVYVILKNKGGFRHNRGCDVAKAALRF